MASLLLGLAVGAKFWPVILLPVILRPVFGDWKRLIPAALVFIGISLIMFLPFYVSGLDTASGFTAYRRTWEMNDSLFMFILWAVEFGMKTFGASTWHAQGLARIIVFCLLITWTFWGRSIGEFIFRCQSNYDLLMLWENSPVAVEGLSTGIVEGALLRRLSADALY